jgi:hypothetical protein
MMPAAPGSDRKNMARKADKTSRPGAGNGNLVLAQTILEAIKIKAEAGLARNPFTGRPCHKLSDEDAAREAAPDKGTAQLVALILGTRDEAFIDWARNIQNLVNKEP